MLTLTKLLPLNPALRPVFPSPGHPPPVEAYGALVAGYARLRQVRAAVGAVRRYHGAGGSPDVRMLRALADVCVREGEYKVAMQVGVLACCLRRAVVCGQC